MIRCAVFVFAAMLSAPGLADAADLNARLPDGGTATGTGDIRAAWYVGPTERYAHAVLGDAIEAAGLAVKTADGATLTLELPRDAVFEDITPRLADLDGDGRTEVVTLLSTQSGGGALALFGLRDGADGKALQSVAQVPPIGRPNRWLNVAGIADFTGDGRLDVAVVKTPHIGGTLELWSFNGKALTKAASAFGFSNHAIGSRALGLSAVVEMTGDGVADLVLPDAARRTLVAVTYRDGAWVEIAREEAPGGVGGDLSAEATSTGVTIRYPTRTGGVEKVVFR